ncbi:tyrosine kinase receptor Cad96Ca isoform X4 [Drosophila obscura]|uniref:tyrosine kinase receptor Cad96Ca isoform X4 n=1 Tax=Drosophila obscura TaxID=7282 RepID=UPI001BB1DAF4|nr:tyrosine kinase receptor Cad96Ca isoform X4 [Drosophila obscura]
MALAGIKHLANFAMDFQHSHIQNHQSRSKLCKQHIFTCRRNLSFAILIATAGVLSIISKAEAHDQNAPPILYVRERNWRISEAEKVGQIIDRVRAEDPDGDELLFGIEPRFLPPQGSDVEASIPEKLPFHIDSQTGVVYLNESLMGRAGQNFLIYITVSDGRYTAKNEVFINILGQRENMYGYRPQTSISNVVHNISQFLPSFDQLPGVQSIRNGLPNNRPTFNFPPRPHESNSGIPFGNFYPRFPSSNDRTEANSEDQNSPTAPTIGSSTEKSRTKLTPIVVNTSTRPEEPSTKTLHDGSGNTITIFSIKSTTIPFVVTVCGFIATISVFLGYICRHRLCAISKTLKKSKEKEELAKKSNQSQTSNTLSDDGRNSMVMQQWQGPVAFANRYVAWELDQPITTVATSQLSTSVTNIGDASAVGAPCGIADPVDNLMPVSVRSGASSAAAENGLVVDINSDHWEFPRYRLKFFNILGEGAFGQVWRCEATDINGFEGITTVAVKTLKESATEVDRKDLLSELEATATCDIIKVFFGVLKLDPTLFWFFIYRHFILSWKPELQNKKFSQVST